MRIDHVIAHISDEASGPTHSVPSLCRGLSRLGHEVTLHTLEPLPSNRPDIPIVAYPVNSVSGPLESSRQMKRALREAARAADLIHGHGLWKMPNIYPGIAVRNTDSLLVVSPRGMLSPVALRYSRRRKRIFWRWVQARSVERADLIHATSKQEAHDIRELGIRTPIAVVPNGVDVPSAVRPPVSTRRLLFVGRLHPIKGVESLLEAWAGLQDDFPDWHLIVAGPGEQDYITGIHTLAEGLGAARVEFTGGVYGTEKSELFRSAELFVLPSHSEGSPIAVAEALAHSLPVVVTKGAPWQSVETHGCGWWVDVGPRGLGGALRDAMSKDPAILADMGRRGRDLVRSDYSWDHLSEMMERAYLWVLGRGERPPWVMLP